MNRLFSAALALLMLAGCATQAATSGRVVIRDDTAAVDIRIDERDRAHIYDYYRGGKGLPPGLEKHGGLPPGLAKRDRLPPGLGEAPLPYELERRLSRLPSSYVRVRIGRDIVLMDRNTRVVFDVVYGIGK